MGKGSRTNSMHRASNHKDTNHGRLETFTKPNRKFQLALQGLDKQTIKTKLTDTKPKPKSKLNSKDLTQPPPTLSFTNGTPDSKTSSSQRSPPPSEPKDRISFIRSGTSSNLTSERTPDTLSFNNYFTTQLNSLKETTRDRSNSDNVTNLSFKRSQGEPTSDLTRETRDRPQSTTSPSSTHSTRYSKHSPYPDSPNHSSQVQKSESTLSHSHSSHPVVSGTTSHQNGGHVKQYQKEKNGNSSTPYNHHGEAVELPESTHSNREPLPSSILARLGSGGTKRKKSHSPASRKDYKDSRRNIEHEYKDSSRRNTDLDYKDSSRRNVDLDYKDSSRRNTDLDYKDSSRRSTDVDHHDPVNKSRSGHSLSARLGPLPRGFAEDRTIAGIPDNRSVYSRLGSNKYTLHEDHIHSRHHKVSMPPLRYNMSNPGLNLTPLVPLGPLGQDMGLDPTHKGFLPSLENRSFSQTGINPPRFANKFELIRCAFFPNCTRSGCMYFHPTEDCPAGERCPDMEGGCLFIHPSDKKPKMCRFDASCNRSDCPYEHLHRKTTVENPDSFIPIPCQQPQCEQLACLYVHPHQQLPFAKAPCLFGARCNRFPCDRFHSSLFRSRAPPKNNPLLLDIKQSYLALFDGVVYQSGMV